jgi:glycosyltransferase involved in cell wall biosynthesis
VAVRPSAPRPGGPLEIIDHTVNGYIVEPADLQGFTAAILEIYRFLILSGETCRKGRVVQSPTNMG